MDASDEEMTLGQRLMSLHPGESRLSFAKRIGVSDSTLGNYERDERMPDATFLARLRDESGADINWIVTGKSSVAPPDRRVGDDAIVLPRYDVRASAGAGSLVVSENVNEYFSVGRDWLRRNLPPWAPPNAVVGVLENGGDSMEPTIRDGDLLMVVQDVDWDAVARGGIFVFSLDGHLRLKRLQVLMSGDVKIISDNKAYDPEIVRYQELESRLQVHGQVFFAGGKIRSFGL